MLPRTEHEWSGIGGVWSRSANPPQLQERVSPHAAPVAAPRSVQGCGDAGSTGRRSGSKGHFVHKSEDEGRFPGGR